MNEARRRLPPWAWQPCREDAAELREVTTAEEKTVLWGMSHRRMTREIDEDQSTKSGGWATTQHSPRAPSSATVEGLEAAPAARAPHP